MANIAGSASTGRINGRVNGGMSNAAAREAVRGTRLSNNAYRFVFILVIVLASIFTLISLSAYSSKLQIENSRLEQSVENLQAEIASLNNDISKESNDSRIEKLATEKLGMVYPSAENSINIDAIEEADDGVSLAATIRAEAYK